MLHGRFNGLPEAFEPIVCQVVHWLSRQLSIESCRIAWLQRGSWAFVRGALCSVHCVMNGGPPLCRQQWQVGTAAAEGWAAPVDAHWQGAGTQGDPVEPPLYPDQAPLYQGLQDQDGWEASVEDAVVSSTPPAPECPQDQGGWQGGAQVP